MGSKTETTTTTQQNEPWKPAQGALQDILSRAQGLNAKGTSYFPGSTVAPFSGDTMNAMSGVRNMATAGNPLYTQGGQGLLSGLNNAMSTANGDYLHNPAELTTLFNSMSGNIQDAVNSQFSASGRTGSPAHAGVMTKELGNLGASIFANNYANERQNQMQATNQLGSLASMIPGYDAAKYNDLNQLMGLGGMQENKTQQGLTEDFNRYMYNQQSPWDNLLKYGGLASGIAGLGGTKTGTQETPTNPFMDTIGGLFGLTGALKNTGAFGPAGWLF